MCPSHSNTINSFFFPNNLTNNRNLNQQHHMHFLLFFYILSFLRTSKMTSIIMLVWIAHRRLSEWCLFNVRQCRFLWRWSQASLGGHLERSSRHGTVKNRRRYSADSRLMYIDSLRLPPDQSSLSSHATTYLHRPDIVAWYLRLCSYFASSLHVDQTGLLPKTYQFNLLFHLGCLSNARQTSATFTSFALSRAVLSVASL